jgi:hypothetical protein
VTRAFVHAIIFSAIFLTAAPAAAQTRPGDPAPPAAEARAQAPAVTADEDFELNIVERRITERDFHAATEVATGDAVPGGFDLRVGARVRADEIDVVLRNVRGSVRFHANLEWILRALAARRGQPMPFRW